MNDIWSQSPGVITCHDHTFATRPTEKAFTQFSTFSDPGDQCDLIYSHSFVNNAHHECYSNPLTLCLK